MRQVLHRGLLQGWKPVEVEVLWGAETRVDNELPKVRGFSKGDRWGFGKKVLG